MSIVKLLKNASQAYYTGKPIMSDFEFDSLAETIGWTDIGYVPKDSDRLPHFNKMYSIKTTFSGEPIPTLPGPLVSSPKLDGAAVSLLYYNGRLIQGLTRGDGVEGLNITDKARQFAPLIIEGTEGLVQITGEVVAPKTIRNSRNYASGALNLKDLEEFKTRDITFIAYSMFPTLDYLWTQDMMFLGTNGFNTVIQSDYSMFPRDGVVFRCDNYSDFESMGYTSQHPKGTYALKEQRSGVVTTLLDVIWQVGKSGVISPVAIVEPVDIEGAIVRKATLHNISYIRELSLEIGCRVEMIRSGEVIPRIVKRVEVQKEN